MGLPKNRRTPGPWTIVNANVIVGDEDDPTEICMSLDSDFRDLLLISAAPDLLAALEALFSNPHLDLGDLVYTIRDRELQGWDGPAVKAWSDAVTAAKAAIKKARGEEVET